MPASGSCVGCPTNTETQSNLCTDPTKPDFPPRRQHGFSDPAKLGTDSYEFSIGRLAKYLKFEGKLASPPQTLKATIFQLFL